MSKRKKATAAEESQPEQARANRPKDPTKSRAGKASAAVRKAKREAGESIARPCQAHRTDGTPCGNSAIRGGLVCSRHGGNAPQVREAANRRLLEMVEPALRELRRIVTSKAATDADKLRAISMVLNRTGFAERQDISVTMREPTKFELLQQELGDSLVIDFERDDLEEVEGGGTRELPNPHHLTDDDLSTLLEERDRRRQREAQTRLDHAGHEVVRAEPVPGETEAERELFGYSRPAEPDESRRDYGTRRYERE